MSGTVAVTVALSACGLSIKSGASRKHSERLTHGYGRRGRIGRSQLLSSHPFGVTCSTAGFTSVSAFPKTQEGPPRTLC